MNKEVVKFIDDVIKDIKTNPSNWTSKWGWSKKEVNKSIMNKESTIQIYVNGEFITPSEEINKHLSGENQEILRKLIDEIRQRETFEVLKITKI